LTQPVSVLGWLDHVPLVPLAIGAVLLGLSPPLEEPHLWEKAKMLMDGEQLRPVDLFDLIMHASLPFLLALKLLRLYQSRGSSPD
jgi:hypothetical protein